MQGALGAGVGGREGVALRIEAEEPMARNAPRITSDALIAPISAVTRRTGESESDRLASTAKGGIPRL
jgi:hypothetical protein